MNDQNVNNQSQNQTYQYYSTNPYQNGYGQMQDPVMQEKIRKKNEKLAKKIEKQEARKNGTYHMSIGKRIAVVSLCAVLFGVCAGGTFLGVSYGGRAILGLTDKDSANLASSENAESATGNTSEDDQTMGTHAEEPKDTVSSTADNAVSNTSNSTALYVMDVSDVAAMCMPSIVSIQNNYTTVYNYYGQRYEQESQASGSGIIIGQSDTELLLVTNYHVVADADELIVTFIDESTANANMKGYDADMDIAVISISLSSLTNDTLDAIAIAVLGDSDDAEVGEPAIAIGNALGYGQSVTLGIISALNRELEMDGVTHTLVQTDAAINPGNSGGALLNMNGEVIGINSNKIGGETIEGMGYAIPITLVRDLIEELSLKDTLVKVEDGKQGYLGIYGQDVTDEVVEMYGIPKGVSISQVIEGSAAETAGLQRGDIITRLDETTITSMDDLVNLLQYYEAGTTVQITISRRINGAYEESVISLNLGTQTVTQE